MSSLLETLVAAVKTRLEGINGSPNYTYHVLAVERWKHEYEGQEEFVNKVGTLPAILIQTQSGDPGDESTGTVDMVDETISIDIQFFLELSANDEDKINALADLKKALFGGNQAAAFLAICGLGIWTVFRRSPRNFDLQLPTRFRRPGHTDGINPWQSLITISFETSRSRRQSKQILAWQ
jgi:hypothetical protein